MKHKYSEWRVSLAQPWSTSTLSEELAWLNPEAHCWSRTVSTCTTYRALGQGCAVQRTVYSCTALLTLFLTASHLAPADPSPTVPKLTPCTAAPQCPPARKYFLQQVSRKANYKDIFNSFWIMSVYNSIDCASSTKCYDKAHLDINQRTNTSNTDVHFCHLLYFYCGKQHPEYENCICQQSCYPLCQKWPNIKLNMFKLHSTACSKTHRSQTGTAATWISLYLLTCTQTIYLFYSNRTGTLIYLLYRCKVSENAKTGGGGHTDMSKLQNWS